MKQLAFCQPLAVEFCSIVTVMNGSHAIAMEEESSKVDQALELQALRRVMAAYAKCVDSAESALAVSLN